MKLYEIRVETVDMDWGRHTGYEHIAYCISENKANEIAKTFAEKHEINQWWMIYGKNTENHINVEIIDKGIITE